MPDLNHNGGSSAQVYNTSSSYISNNHGSSPQLMYPSSTLQHTSPTYQSPMPPQHTPLPHLIYAQTPNGQEYNQNYISSPHIGQVVPHVGQVVPSTHVGQVVPTTHVGAVLPVNLIVSDATHEVSLPGLITTEPTNQVSTSGPIKIISVQEICGPSQDQSMLIIDPDTVIESVIESAQPPMVSSSSNDENHSNEESVMMQNQSNEEPMSTDDDQPNLTTNCPKSNDHIETAVTSSENKTTPGSSDVNLSLSTEVKKI